MHIAITPLMEKTIVLIMINFSRGSANIDPDIEFHHLVINPGFKLIT